MTLEEYRKKYGIGVREMARILKCNPSLICHYEKGRQKPSSIMKHLISLVTKGEVVFED